MAAFDLAAHIERSRGPGLVWAYERQQLHALTAEEGILEVTPQEQPLAARIGAARQRG